MALQQDVCAPTSWGDFFYSLSSFWIDWPEISVLKVLGDFEDAIKNIRLDSHKSGGDNIQKVINLAEPSVLVFIKI